MQRTISGYRNLNELPRSSLMFSDQYRGKDRLPVISGYRYYAGLLKDNPIRYFDPNSRPMVSVRRQARPYGVQR